MIKLIDLIDLAGVELGDFKIHCATGSNPTPLEAFFDGSFKEWQEYQHQKNFQCEQIISLIHLGQDRWLLAGVYAVKGFVPKQKPDGRHRRYYLYDTEEITGLAHLTGRAIVRFSRTFRASYLRGDKYADKLIVEAIREKRMTIGDFPGFNSVLLTFRMLRTVVREANPSWRTALANVAGVYLITDTSTGKHYVGSAYGGEGIWQRWTSYAKDGHGGNKVLRQLIQDDDQKYPDEFQFSLLEVCDLYSSGDYVISRETHWKEVLKSREFGLNDN